MRVAIQIQTFFSSCMRAFDVVRDFLRPGLLIVVALGVLLGTVLSDQPRLPEDVLTGETPRTCLSASVLAWAVSWYRRKVALWPVAALAVIGALALAWSASHLHVAFLVGVLLVVASWQPFARRISAVRSVEMPLAASFVLIYGGWADGFSGPVLLAAILAFLMVLPREVMTLAAPTRGARTTALAAICTAILLTPLPFLLFDYRGIYLLFMLVADGIMLWAFWLHAQERAPERAHTILDIAIAAVAVALALGAVVRLGD